MKKAEEMMSREERRGEKERILQQIHQMKSGDKISFRARGYTANVNAYGGDGKEIKFDWEAEYDDSRPSDWSEDISLEEVIKTVEYHLGEEDRR